MSGRQMFVRRDGLTLVEVVVAIAILAFAMAAAGALATTTIRTSTEAGRRTQASTLATREAESVRSLQSNLAETSGTPDTLFDYLDQPGNARRYNNGNVCFSFAMRQADSTATGWETVLPGGPHAPVRFQDSDFEKDADKYFPGFRNFSRLVSVCQAEEYKVGTPNTNSKYILDMRVRVTWREADDKLREVKTRSVLSAPGFVDEQ